MESWETASSFGGHEENLTWNIMSGSCTIVVAMKHEQINLTGKNVRHTAHLPVSEKQLVMVPISFLPHKFHQQQCIREYPFQNPALSKQVMSPQA